MKEKRLIELETYIDEKETVTLTELSKVFNVSLNTIRRDINYLETNGVLKKVYGGVTSLKGNRLTPFSFRKTKNADKKEQIGKLASNYINNGDLIFIDSGTTTAQILPNLTEGIQFTLLTNNFDVVTQATMFDNIEIIILGNRYYRNTRSFIQSPSATFSTPYNITKAFMSATGISIKNGLTNSDSHEQEIKKYMVTQSSQTYLLVDDSKFDKSSLITYSSLSKIHNLITNSTPSSDYVDFFQKNKIKLIIPN